MNSRFRIAVQWRDLDAADVEVAAAQRPAEGSDAVPVRPVQRHARHDAHVGRIVEQPRPVGAVLQRVAAAADDALAVHREVGAVDRQQQHAVQPTPRSRRIGQRHRDAVLVHYTPSDRQKDTSVIVASTVEEELTNSFNDTDSSVFKVSSYRSIGVRISFD